MIILGLAEAAVTFMANAWPVLQAAYGIVDPTHAQEIVGELLALNPGLLSSPDDADVVAAALAQFHATDPDAFLPDRGNVYATAVVGASLRAADRRSISSSLDYQTVDDRRRTVRIARARLRAEGRAIPEAPATTPNGSPWIVQDHLAASAAGVAEPAPALQEARKPDAVIVSSIDKTPPVPTPAVLESRLGALRAEIEALGGTYEPVWGFRHLSGEIDRLHAEKENAS